MDINVLEFYRIFAGIGFILVVKQILFLCNKHQNATYFKLPFWISAFLWAMETVLFALVDVFGKPDGLNIIESQSTAFMFYFFFLVQVGLTVLLYVFSGKYAEYHIVYNAKKSKHRPSVNLEESYIILYGLLKFNKKKIFMCDIIAEDSFYAMESLRSKMFPYAAVLGSREYFSAKLKNGAIVNIFNMHGILSGATCELIKLTKVLGVKYV